MSMFDSLKKLGLVTDDEKPQEKKPVAENTAPRVRDTGSTAVAPDAGAAISTGQGLDLPAISAAIQLKIEAHPSYVSFATFLKVSESMASVLTDEAVRYKAAQATTGVARDTLVQSVKDAVELVLTSEEHGFEVHTVDVLTHQIETVMAHADELTAQIQEVTAKLGALSEERSNAIKLVQTSKSDLEKMKIDFETITNTISSNYDEIVRKLQQNLGA